MLKYRHYTVLKASCITVLAVIYDSFLERIVHNAVKLTAYEITSADTVALLVGRILPYLAVDDLVVALGFYRLIEIVKEFIGKLIGNVKSPASCTLVYPAL